MATLELIASKPPIIQDEDGVLRVGGTRVRFETVVCAFNNGCTAEEIVAKYPAVNLKDVYSVIAYYLRHMEDVEQYLADREAQIEEADHEIDVRHPSAGIRDRLLARRAHNPENLDTASR